MTLESMEWFRQSARNQETTPKKKERYSRDKKVEIASVPTESTKGTAGGSSDTILFPPHSIFYPADSNSYRTVRFFILIYNLNFS